MFSDVVSLFRGGNNDPAEAPSTEVQQFQREELLGYCMGDR